METCKGKLCPLLDRPCLEHACAFYQSVLGKSPQTDEVINHYDCAFRWHTMLLIENTKAVRETDDEISAFRADTHKTQAHFAASMLGAVVERKALK